MSAYQGVVEFDEPAAYWRMDDAVAANTQLAATVGPPLAGPSVWPAADSLIVGDSGYAASIASSAIFKRAAVNEGDVLDLEDLAAVSLELWVKTAATFAGSGAGTELVRGPQFGPIGSESEILGVRKSATSGAFDFRVNNSAGTPHVVTSSVLTPAQTYHFVCVVSGSTITLYQNGAAIVAGSWSGVLPGMVGVPYFYVEGIGGGPNVVLDELAVYRYGLSADRVFAHYEAGRLRGFVAQPAGDRIGAILDAVGSNAPRRLDPGVRDVIPRSMTGQDPLGEAKLAARADLPDALVFVARDGAIVFLDADHRSSSPYDTVQATFGDGGGSELAYRDLDVDYSDSFLRNEIRTARVGGELQTASDSASKGEYDERPESLTDLPVTTDVDAEDIGDAVLAKFKDPMYRVRSFKPAMHKPEVAAAVNALDIGDRIRLLRTPVGGGARIDQTLFVQKIDRAGTPYGPRVVTLHVSPV